MSRWTHLLVGVMSVAVLTGACDSARPSPAVSPGTTSAAASAGGAALSPSIAAASCPDDVRADIVIAISCGFLTVLEDRTKPGGRTIQLFFARFDPPGGTTTSDPLITMGALGDAPDYGGMAQSGQRTHRVLYLLDPRGIGHSKPSLDCPEVVAVGPDLAGFRLRDPARQTILVAAVRACHDRLVGQGVDLEAYDLHENANDMDDLRTTLGIASWNINTNGSANRLAFEVAQRFPGTVRSMVIDSPSLPSPDFLTIGPTSLDLAIDTLAAACTSQVACARQFPHLAKMVREGLARLDANPITLDVSGTVDAINLGHPIRIVMDGAALLRVIRFGLGSQGGNGASRALTTIRAVLDGTLDATDSLVLALASDTGDCLGMLAICEDESLGSTYSIICRDFATQVDTSRLTASVAGRVAYVDVFSPSALLVPCAAWGVSPAAHRPPGSLTDGIPILVVRGTFDPYSAASSEVAEAAAGAPNVYLVDVPNQSYNALGFNECVVRFRNAWVDAPTSPPADTSCLGSIPPIDLAR
jgi:pimeloyl-ACP methyl ester carboxylesterase